LAASSRVRFGLLAVLCACARPDESATTAVGPDILLVTVEALRADRVPGARPAAPFIASLGGKGRSWTRATATSSWAMPSVASMLTGRLPQELGLHAPPWVQEGEDWYDVVLPADVAVLPEVLSERGYDTIAVSASPFVDRSHGFARGFDHFVEVPLGDSNAVWRSLLPLETAIATRDRPTFVWLHLIDPAEPWVVREPWFQRWVDDYEAWLFVNAPRGADGAIQRLDGVGTNELEARGVREDAEQLAMVTAVYDSEVAAVDSLLSRAVVRLGFGPEDVVAVVGATGEGLTGGLGHYRSLDAEQTHVPMVMTRSGSEEAEVVEAPTSVAVLGPMLAELGGGSLVSKARPAVAQMTSLDGTATAVVMTMSGPSHDGEGLAAVLGGLEVREPELGEEVASAAARAYFER
jgi:arylsulfatase A-like enzyme